MPFTTSKSSYMKCRLLYIWNSKQFILTRFFSYSYHYIAIKVRLVFDRMMKLLWNGSEILQPAYQESLLNNRNRGKRSNIPKLCHQNFGNSKSYWRSHLDKSVRQIRGRSDECGLDSNNYDKKKSSWNYNFWNKFLNLINFTLFIKSVIKNFMRWHILQTISFYFNNVWK